MVVLKLVSQALGRAKKEARAETLVGRGTSGFGRLEEPANSHSSATSHSMQLLHGDCGPHTLTDEDWGLELEVLTQINGSRNWTKDHATNVTDSMPRHTAIVCAIA